MDVDTNSTSSFLQVTNLRSYVGKGNLRGWEGIHTCAAGTQGYFLTLRLLFFNIFLFGSCLVGGHVGPLLTPWWSFSFRLHHHHIRAITSTAVTAAATSRAAITITLRGRSTGARIRSLWGFFDGGLLGRHRECFFPLDFERRKFFFSLGLASLGSLRLRPSPSTLGLAGGALVACLSWDFSLSLPSEDWEGNNLSKRLEWGLLP